MDDKRTVREILAVGNVNAAVGTALFERLTDEGIVAPWLEVTVPPPLAITLSALMAGCCETLSSWRGSTSSSAVTVAGRSRGGLTTAYPGEAAGDRPASEATDSRSVTGSTGLEA